MVTLTAKDTFGNIEVTWRRAGDPVTVHSIWKDPRCVSGIRAEITWTTDDYAYTRNVCLGLFLGTNKEVDGKYVYDPSVSATIDKILKALDISSEAGMKVLETQHFSDKYGL